MAPLARSLAALSLLAGAARALAAQAGADLGARIDRYLHPYVATDNLSGVVLVYRGRVLYHKGYGLAAPAFKVPNTPATRFHIASLTKAFTAAAVLLLEDRGKLRTSDPVARYLPDFPHGDRITIEQLLVHGSGIPNVDPGPPPGDRPFTAETVVRTFRDKPLAFEPGTRFAYSNSDYNLLALIVERVASVPWDVFLAANLLKPLGLSATTHDGDPTRVIPLLAAGTQPRGLRGVQYVPYTAWSGKIGSGSLVSSTMDVCRFTSALFGGRLVSAASLAKLKAATGVFPYGWEMRERAGRKVMGVGGRSPGFIANVDYFLDDGTCIAILTNSYSSVGQVIADDLASIVAGRRVTAPPITYARPTRGRLAAYTGRYRLPDDYYDPNATITIRDLGDYLEGEWSSGFASVIYPTGRDDFVDRTNWAMVHFERDADGHVAGFRYRLLQDFEARKLP